MATLFSLSVRDREKIIFDGEVLSVSSKNSSGNFDILGYHANFISLIDKILTIRDATGVVTEIAVGKGVVRVRDNKIEVFVGIG